MPVVPFEVYTGYRVEARDADLGTIREIFQGPPRSIFVDEERYLRVTQAGQPDLFIPFSEIVDVSELKQTSYVRRWLREINALGWTRDPRNPSAPIIPYTPREGARRGVPGDDHLLPNQAVFRGPSGEVLVGPRPRQPLGTWQPGDVAPRPEPGKNVRIGDRFKPGDPIPVPGTYMCTVCWARKHSRQFLEENPEGKFPPAHHPGALWELEDLRP